MYKQLMELEQHGFSLSPSQLTKLRSCIRNNKKFKCRLPHKALEGGVPLILPPPVAKKVRNSRTKGKGMELELQPDVLKYSVPALIDSGNAPKSYKKMVGSGVIEDLIKKGFNTFVKTVKKEGKKVGKDFKKFTKSVKKGQAKKALGQAHSLARRTLPFVTAADPYDVVGQKVFGNRRQDNILVKGAQEAVKKTIGKKKAKKLGAVAGAKAGQSIAASFGAADPVSQALAAATGATVGDLATGQALGEDLSNPKGKVEKSLNENFNLGKQAEKRIQKLLDGEFESSPPKKGKKKKGKGFKAIGSRKGGGCSCGSGFKTIGGALPSQAQKDEIKRRQASTRAPTVSMHGQNLKKGNGFKSIGGKGYSAIGGSSKASKHSKEEVKRKYNHVAQKTTGD